MFSGLMSLSEVLSCSLSDSVMQSSPDTVLVVPSVVTELVASDTRR